ncbi:preprotein translocase subunit SecE [Patescibacteria group bacterium]|nr:preprotein translocase subunit SecE [Patescibacteria group bacterium]
MTFSLTENKVVTFLKEARVELSKVVWPTRQELIRHTAIVIGISLGTALYLGVLDLIFQGILERVI